MNRIIRRATRTDIPFCQATEREALARHADDPTHAFVVALDVREKEEFDPVFEHGIAFIAEVETDPVGFILIKPVDGRAHLMELAVRMAHQRAGHGRALLSAGESWARRNGYRELTLTCFRDLAWQGPTYARYGFETFIPDPDRIEMAAVRTEEKDAGYDAAPRICMTKRLDQNEVVRG